MCEAYVCTTPKPPKTSIVLGHEPIWDPGFKPRGGHDV